MKSKEIAEQLAETGLCICPDFLSPRFLNLMAEDLERNRRDGKFKNAGVGKGTSREVQATIRSDETLWLERDEQNFVQRKLWRKIDLLKAAFNRSLFLGLKDFEGHYAVYPEGGFYQRHRDVFKNDSARVVSIIIYLNREWQPTHGGQLRIYNADPHGKDSHIDINPVGGTMVCFLSRESEHEVMPSFHERLSFSGWFKRSTN
jgi:SM-20-related protein